MTIPFFSKVQHGDDAARPPTRVFVPKDAAAIAVGAEEVAAAIVKVAAAAGQAIDIVGTDSRGMLWLEPLIEVEVGGVRHGFGPTEAPAQSFEVFTHPQRVAGLEAPGCKHEVEIEHAA